MRVRTMVVGLVFSVALFAPTWGDDDKGIKVVPREQVQQERAKRWAVLIGVDKYEDETGIGSLKYCGQDMKLLYRVLTGPAGGFAPENVLLMTQDAIQPKRRPTRSFIVTMVPNWLSDAKPEDDVLIAFSGHGVEQDGKAYLLPSDAMHANAALTGIPVSLVKDWLANCRAKRKILILDACHSGAGKEAPAMSEAFWEDAERGEGFVRLASCGPKQKSNEDDDLVSLEGKGHGVFTYYLAEGLEGKGDYDRDRPAQATASTLADRPFSP